MNCPGCSQTLHPTPIREGLAGACQRGGGLWLDNIATPRLVAGILSPDTKGMATHVQRVAAAAPRQPYRAPADAGTRACPGCGAALSQSVIVGITIDVCTAHGTWFDPGELVALSQYFEMKAINDDVEAEAFGKQMAQERWEDAATDLGMARRILRFLV